jgi:hypothetical protein
LVPDRAARGDAGAEVGRRDPDERHRDVLKAPR